MEIPYGKIVVYLLTFMGYIYSGYGSGLLNNLRDAVLSAENIFGSVLTNIVNIANNFRNLNEVFDAAVEENCYFKCKNDAIPVPNRDHQPKADGCGSLGLKIPHEYLPIGEMTKCCDQHDICYDTCNNDKEVCDVNFKRCLYRYCDTYQSSIGGATMVKACKTAAKMLFTGTLTLGCKSYLNAQEKACFCPAYGWKDTNYKRDKRYKRGDEL